MKALTLKLDNLICIEPPRLLLLMRMHRKYQFPSFGCSTQANAVTSHRSQSTISEMETPKMLLITYFENLPMITLSSLQYNLKTTDTKKKKKKERKSWRLAILEIYQANYCVHFLYLRMLTLYSRKQRRNYNKQASYNEEKLEGYLVELCLWWQKQDHYKHNM